MLKTRLSQGITCENCATNFLCLPRGLNSTETMQLNQVINTIRNIPKKEHAFHVDTVMQNLYAVYQGSCKEYWLDEHGNECVTNFYLPGDIIGVESLPNRKHMFSVSALEDTKLCVIPINQFLQLMQQQPNILKRFINITSFKMQNDQSIHLSTTANQKVCDFILNMAYRRLERNPNEKDILFPMSQLEISNFLGIAYETVNRIFQHLKKNKIIKMKNKVINILNFEELKKIGRLEFFPQL